ncbi:MAG: hypothetical protein COY69_01890 [Candidatus Magasanikbacteria bacterium CG_4_10_14_0_8_um_filter_32_14]|uniref:Uncharacterized protein n=1 Tax=Candidatus Magasanikbacteria bacterium CG_4_10_14_0_8_um_filter_32_14 TaxID=1974640 RepID=A0A2M7RAL5_9BACT|nr:MAG: hypothetical protein COY69_01890 [Candidatus Magasanikbacteria bacterium CG_4_10_14_0_8_um_filter_32_14]
MLFSRKNQVYVLSPVKCKIHLEKRHTELVSVSFLFETSFYKKDPDPSADGQDDSIKNDIKK